MTRIVKVISITLVTVFVLMSTTSCGNKLLIDLSYDDQINSKGRYNENIFYCNDLDTLIADPFILYITDEDSDEHGYYYLYGTLTSTSFEAYRSKDLQNWENVSKVNGYSVFVPAEDNYADTYLWAPEVVYDKTDEKYYMFYSAGLKDPGSRYSRIGVAVSDEPYGPFVEVVDKTHNASTPLFDASKVNEVLAEEDRSDDMYAIDPHPFVDQDGTKYLYFCRQLDPGDGNKCPVWALKMNSWTKPDYSTLTRITRVGRSKTEGGEVLKYENSTSHNEGPFVYAHQTQDGKCKYYLAFSINGYADKSYTVVQAVADNPLGPFEKISEENGGLILSTDHQSWDHISGPGHHCIIQIGDEIFISYHEHIEREKGNSERAFAYDRVEFVQNPNGDEIMYVNGPTWSLQPKIEAFSDYKNIAADAKVFATNGENVPALTDKLLSLYKSIDFVKEFTAKKSTTITLDFGEYREITGIMIYNGKDYRTAFPYIDRIEFDFKNDQLEKGATAFIDDLKFDWSRYKNMYAEEMRPGGSAVAIFNPLKVKKIRIKLKFPVKRPSDIELVDSDGYVVEQAKVAISEIAVLGK